MRLEKPGGTSRGRAVKALSAVALAVSLAFIDASADGVGFRDILVEVDGERLTTALWYPTDEPSGRMTLGTFSMAANPGAPLGTGSHGLVLISHGTGGGRLNHRGTAIRLAEAGYVVGAPEHAGDSWRDDRFSGTSTNWQRRPRQMRAVLNRLLADPEFGRRIDPARIGAVGHSAGGYTVLALIGARADLRLLAQHCTVHIEGDPRFCGYGRPEGRIGGRLPDLSDPRIRAVVAVAPVGALFGEESFENASRSAQIHRLGADRILRRPWHADNIVKLMGSSAKLVVHPKAHHFAFISPFPDALLDEVGAPAHDPAGFDRNAFLSRIDGLIVGFFEDVLSVP